MIELLHSYQYIPNRKSNIFINNDMIIQDKNNTFFGLANVPQNSIYKIRLDKFKTKKRSLKKNRNQINHKFINLFSNQSNLKVVIEIDYLRLLKNIDNDIFPCKNEICKILRRSLKPSINYDDNLIDIIDKIKYFHEYTWFKNREENIDSINYLPYNIYKLRDIYINLEDNTFTRDISKVNNYILLKGGIVLNNIEKDYSNFIKLINNTSKNNKTLIITKNKLEWNKYLQNNKDVVYLDNDDIKKTSLNKKKYYRIIFEDCIEDKHVLSFLKKFKTEIRWYLSSKTYLLNYQDLSNIYNLIFSFNLTCYDKDYVKKTSHCFINYDKFKNYNFNLKKVKIDLTESEKNFYKKYCQKDDPSVYFSLPLNKTNTRFITNKQLNIYNKCNNNFNNKCNKECCICLSKIPKNNIGVSECNHYFCYSCLYKYVSNSLKCPMCRNKLSLNTIYKVINNNIKNEKFPSKIKYILDFLEKNKDIIIIISKYENSINSLEKFFDDLNIKDNIILSTYENLYKINKNYSKDIILMEPLNYTYSDYYNKCLLRNKFSFNNIFYLTSKNTYEDFI